jgi:mannosyltransferase OCH1-like enzyme
MVFNSLINYTIILTGGILLVSLLLFARFNTMRDKLVKMLISNQEPYQSVYWGEKNIAFSVKKIPKNLYMCGNDSMLTLNIRKHIQCLKENNSDFQYNFYNDEEMQVFINTYMPEEVIRAYSYLKHPVMKADLFRYCIIYVKGGIYLDLKSGTSTPLNCILNQHPETECFLGTWGGLYESIPQLLNSDLHRRIFSLEGEYMQWFLAARPGHPIMKTVIEHVVQNVLFTFPAIYQMEMENRNLDQTYFLNFYGKNGIFICTGPTAFTVGVNKSIKEYADKDLNLKHLGRYKTIFNRKIPDFPFIYNAAYPTDQGHRKQNKHHYSHYTQRVVEWC